MKNDTRIKALLKQIEEKKNTLGSRPKAKWETNCSLDMDGSRVNLNTVTTVNRCIDIMGFLLGKKGNREDAAILLKVRPDSFMWGPYSFDEWLHDIELRCAMIMWDEENKKLKKLEAQLKDLRSEDAKTADALSDIAGALK